MAKASRVTRVVAESSATTLLKMRTRQIKRKPSQPQTAQRMTGLPARKPRRPLQEVAAATEAPVVEPAEQRAELVAAVADHPAAVVAEAEPSGGTTMTSTCNQASAPEIS